MADTFWAAEGGDRQAPAHRGWVRVAGLACRWLSTAVLILVLVGLCVVVVFGLAHHAAPAGGGA